MSIAQTTAAVTGQGFEGQDMNARALRTRAEDKTAGGRTEALVSDPPFVGRNNFDAGSNPLNIKAQKLRPQELAMDAVGVIGVDSARRGRFEFDAAGAGSYVMSSALYQMFGAQLLQQPMTGITGDPELEYAMGKILFNTVSLGLVGRIFGRGSTIPQSFMTSLGAETISYAVGDLAFGGGPYVGPFPK